MDPIKESLIHAVGNLDKQEANVHAKVLSSIQGKLKNKQKLKWFPIWIPAIALASFMIFFAVQMIQPSPIEQRTASLELTKEDYQFLYEIMQETSSSNPDEYNFDFVAQIAFPHYAKAMDITLDEKELAKRIEAISSSLKKSLHYQSEPNAKYYETVYIPLIAYSTYSKELLLEHYQINYPSFNQETIEKLIQYNAIVHFMTLDEAEWFAPNEELANIANITNTKATVTILYKERDYIIAVENGNYFELDGLSPEQIASFHKGVYKIPIDLLNGKNVGNTVEISFWKTEDADYIFPDNLIEILPVHASDSFSSFEIDDPTSTKFIALIKNLEWTKWTSFENATYQLGILFEDQHYIIQFNSALDHFTIYDMLDEEKTIVPTQLNSQLIDLIKSAKFPSIKTPQK